MSYVVINEMTTLSFRNAFLKQEGFRAVLTIIGDQFHPNASRIK